MDTTGIKDSTTLELHADIKDSTTLVANGDMKVPAASELVAEMKGRALETSIATNFTAARPSVALRSRTHSLGCIPAPLVDTTTVGPRGATRIVAPRAYTVAALVEAVFTEVAATVD